MALTASQIASRLFKKSLNAGETLVTRQFFEEPRLGGPFILSEQIWSESDLIPNTAPVLASGASSGVVQYFEKELLTHVSGSGNLAYFSTSLIDSIPFNYGTSGTYNYQLYKNDGTTSIAFGEGDWLVDNSAGLLTFYGTLPSGVSSASAPRISFYKYIGSKGVSSGGGTGSGSSGSSGTSGSSGSSGTSGIGGGTQSLQQTLSVGNDLGTYSIVRQGTSDITKKFYISNLNDDFFISAGTVSGATAFEGGTTLRMGSELVLNNGSDGSAGTPGFNFRITKTNLVVQPPTGGGTFLYGKTWFPITSTLLATDTGGYLVATASPTLEKTLINGNITGDNQILLATGSAAAPSIAFESDSNTGIYRLGGFGGMEDQVAFSAGGDISMVIGTHGMYVNPQGSLSLPSIRFGNNQGFYNTSANDLRVAINNTLALNLSLTNSVVQTLHTSGTNSIPSISFESDPDTGFYRQSENSIGVSSGGSQSIIFNQTGIILPSLPNTLLATDTFGQIVATAASGISGSSGTSGVSGGGGTGSSVGSFTLVLDGQGGVVSTGQKGYLQTQYSGTITGYSIIANPVGSVSFDVWKRSGQLPTVSDSIVGGNYPGLTGGSTFSTTTLTGWTTSFSSGDYFGWNVRSVATSSFVRLELVVTKS